MVPPDGGRELTESGAICIFLPVPRCIPCPGLGCPLPSAVPGIHPKNRYSRLTLRQAASQRERGGAFGASDGASGTIRIPTVGPQECCGGPGGVYPIETPKVPDLRSWHPGPQLTSRNHARPAPSRQMADSWGTWGLAHSRNLPAGKTRASVQWFPGGKEGSIRLRRT